MLFFQQNEAFMKKYLKLLKETNLFEGIDESAIEAMLGTLYSLSYSAFA